jgi:hypothetical protein
MNVAFLHENPGESIHELLFVNYTAFCECLWACGIRGVSLNF